MPPEEDVFHGSTSCMRTRCTTYTQMLFFLSILPDPIFVSWSLLLHVSSEFTEAWQMH